MRVQKIKINNIKRLDKKKGAKNPQILKNQKNNRKPHKPFNKTENYWF